jgi:MOSC domain-containing protein YiiM
MNARLAAVCVGRTERRGTDGAADPFDRPWESAIWKSAVAGPVHVHALGVDGDAQADQRVHGGPEKAVLAYSLAHYATAWCDVLGEQLAPGAFGENLAVEGLDESTVAIGDVFTIGSARLQVSQPRGPCWKLVRKLRRDDLVERVIENGFTGWYLRVLEAGVIAAGQSFAVVDRPHPALTIAVVNRVLHHKPLDRDAATALAACAALAPNMRRQIANKLAAPP